MLQSNRISRVTTVYVLAILLGSVTLSGVRASAAELPLETAIKKFCSNLLSGPKEPVDLRGLKWVDVRDGLGQHFIALRAGAQKSKLYVRDFATSEVTVIEEDDVEFISNLNRFYLARPIAAIDGNMPGDRTHVLKPNLVNGRIVLEASVNQLPAEFIAHPEFASTITKDPVFPGRLNIQMNHIPTVTLLWNTISSLKLVPVDGGEIDPVEYLRYLKNNRVPVSLDGVFLHDMFAHALGFQYLAAKPEWAEVKAAINEAVEYADAHPKMKSKQKKQFERALFQIMFGVELGSSKLSGPQREQLYFPSLVLNHIKNFRSALQAIPE